MLEDINTYKLALHKLDAATGAIRWRQPISEFDLGRVVDYMTAGRTERGAMPSGAGAGAGAAPDASEV